jgi:NosR/NirI family nitrous oxide reductase transcriptional regulator
MDITGHFVGVKVLKHSEPILLLGIPESALLNFNNQYIGKSVAQNIEVGQSRPEENILGLDAISGATVTVIAQNQVMMTSGTNIARQVGILAPTVRDAAQYVETRKSFTWDELVEQGSVQRLLVKTEQVGLDPSSDPFIELWFGDLNHPDVGRSVLGELGFRNLRDRLKPGEHAIFIVRTRGGESFKGSGFVRGGIYDRIQVKQGADAFTFRDLDYLNLYGYRHRVRPVSTSPASFSSVTRRFLQPIRGNWRSWAIGSIAQRAHAVSPVSIPNTGSQTPCCRAAVRL